MLGFPYNILAKICKGDLTLITSGLEDYLELIYTTIKQNKDIKAIDIANRFGVSRPSVSEALIRLADLDLIVYEGRKGIKITEQGITEAKKISKKHQTLCKFFQEILGEDEISANKNACKIEHVIDQKLVEKIRKFSNFCKDNNTAKAFQEYIHK